MPFLIGAVLAIAVGLFATTTGMDRDRAFYPVVAMVVASYYVLFAVLGHSTEALVLDAAVGTIFVVLAVAGFKRSLWLAVLALAGHGLMDFAHGSVIDNPGVPPWWPAFCGAYDVAAAVYLAWLLRSGRLRAVS
jgi:hypothetical protein